MGYPYPLHLSPALEAAPGRMCTHPPGAHLCYGPLSKARKGVRGGLGRGEGWLPQGGLARKGEGARGGMLGKGAREGAATLGR